MVSINKGFFKKKTLFHFPNFPKNVPILNQNYPNPNHPVSTPLTLVAAYDFCGSRAGSADTCLPGRKKKKITVAPPNIFSSQRLTFVIRIFFVIRFQFQLVEMQIKYNNEYRFVTDTGIRSVRFLVRSKRSTIYIL